MDAAVHTISPSSSTMYIPQTPDCKHRFPHLILPALALLLHLFAHYSSSTEMLHAGNEYFREEISVVGVSDKTDLFIQDSPRFRHDQKTLYNITVCAILNNEAPHLLEWLEFHRSEGVDHFVLYTDRSIDGVELFPRLYEESGIHDFVEVLPAVVRYSNFTQHNGDSKSHFLTQRAILHHCYHYIDTKTKWFLFIDVDEYITTQRSYYLTDELNRPKWNDAKSILVRTVVYSANGNTREFKIFPAVDRETDRVAIMYAPASNYYKVPNYAELPPNVTSDTAYPLDIETHTRRMPLIEMDGMLSKLPKECASPKSGRWFYQCPQKIGKSFMRPRVCEQLGVHYCIKYYDNPTLGGVGKGESGIEIWDVASTDEFMMHHFYVRTELRISQEYAWKSVKRSAYAKYDKTYFSFVKDNSLGRRFSSRIRNSIHQFNIKVIADDMQEDAG